MALDTTRLRLALKALGMREAEVEETLRLVQSNPGEALAKLRAVLKPVAPDLVEALEREARVGSTGGPTVRIPVDPEFGFEAARQVLSPGQGYLIVERRPGLARKLLKAYTSGGGGPEGILLDFAGGLALRGPKIAVVRPLKGPEDVLEALQSFLQEHRKAAVLAELQGGEDVRLLEEALEVAAPQEAVMMVQAEPDGLSEEGRKRLQRKFWSVTWSTEKREGRRRPVLMVSMIRPGT